VSDEFVMAMTVGAVVSAVVSGYIVFRAERGQLPEFPEWTCWAMVVFTMMVIVGVWPILSYGWPLALAAATTAALQVRLAMHCRARRMTKQ